MPCCIAISRVKSTCAGVYIRQCFDPTEYYILPEIAQNTVNITLDSHAAKNSGVDEYINA